jgi:hypothetical protein
MFYILLNEQTFRKFYIPQIGSVICPESPNQVYQTLKLLFPTRSLLSGSLFSEDGAYGLPPII